VLLLITACAPAAPPAPTAAPAKPPEQPAATQPAAAQPAAAKPADKGAVQKEGPSVQLKFASAIAEGDLLSQAARYWGDLVTQRTGGRITFQYFWAASLLRLTELFDGVRDGRADVGAPATSYISGKVPDVAALEVLFSYPMAPDDSLKFQDEVNPILDEIYQKFGQKQLWSNTALPPTMVICKDKFLDTAAAWRGALVRTAGRWQGEVVKAWGANPTVIDIADLYASLQRGTVDCALFAYNLYDSFRMYEVAKNVTRFDSSSNYNTTTINLDVWNKLPKADQDILLQTGEEARKYGLELRRQFLPPAIEKWKGLGAKLCAPSKEELTRLRDAMKPVLEAVSAETGEPGKRIMQVVAKYQDRVATGPTEGDATPCPGR
jgi:TRAP-type C4-dicarboxylate transport system substrate-binding protein